MKNQGCFIQNDICTFHSVSTLTTNAAIPLVKEKEKEEKREAVICWNVEEASHATWVD